jgi:transcriptional regulator with XRE-family HTH domain
MQKKDVTQPSATPANENGVDQSQSVPVSFTTESVSLRDMWAGANSPPESRLGERVRYARNELKLNIEALSRLTKEYDLQGTGLSPTSIARYESGDSLPGIREFRILCESLELPISWLLYGDPTEPSKEPELSEGEKFVLFGLRSMMAEKKEDFSTESTSSFNWFNEVAKAQSRNEKLARARKPQ